MSEHGQRLFIARATLGQAHLGPDPDAPAQRRLAPGQARLVVALELSPGDAALLLHAGVADPDGLAAADAHHLHRQIGRLQRRLSATGLPPVSLTTVRGWVVQAAAAAGRSWN